jgi:thioredoxin 1
LRNRRIINITDENFDELTFDNPIPVMVFFGSKSCKVCKELFPIIWDLSSDYMGKMNTYWVDVDKDKPLFQRFRLRGIPNLLFFSHGEVREKVSGLHPKEVLVDVISKILKDDHLENIDHEDDVFSSGCLACFSSTDN